MPRSLLRTLALSLGLAFVGVAILPAGCKKDEMSAIPVPAEGVALSYALVAGASYTGDISRRETISAREGRFNRVLKFGVQLSVTAVDESGKARVAATVSNIVIDWSVPDLPISLDEFNANAKKQLEGVTIRFDVDPQGRVSDIPAPPPTLDEATVGVLDSLIEGLTSAFYVLPKDPLKTGQTWDDSDTRGREGKLGKYVEETSHGSFVGLFETPDQHKVAQLKIDQDRNETTTTKSGSTSTRVRSATTVLFEIDADYMTRIDSEMTSTQGPNTTTVEFSATWSQTGKGGGGNVSEPEEDTGKEVQRISDPCNDDYVGPDDCLDPCSSNYMGEEVCAAETGETGGETGGGESTSSG